MSAAVQIANTQSVPEHRPQSRLRSGMNITLWILQVLAGVSFCITGFGKMMCYRQDIWEQTLHQPVPWFSAVPQALFVFIGVSEFLGGVGLILPALTRVKPKLTAYASIGLTVVMILAALFHIVRGGEYNFVRINLISAAVTALIVYGRLTLRPVIPKSLSAIRIVSGLAVLGALVLVSSAPLWYMLTHTH